MAQATRETAALIRVSTRQQASDTDSPTNQRTTLAAAGATRFFEYVGSGFKGDGAPRRTSLQPVFDAITTGEIGRLLVTDISRAARSGRVVDELITHCDRHDVEFLAGGMAFSHEGSMQWFSARQMADIAELQSRQQREKILRGQAAALARGLPVTGNTAWHLQPDPEDRHKAVPAPGWADAREAVIRYIKGEWSATDVAAFLYARHGKMRTTTSVLAWFRSHSIRGHHGKHKGEVLLLGCYPALVNPEEAEQLDRRIELNRQRNGGKRRYHYALSGITTCHYCKQKLVCSTTTNKAGKQYSYIRCNSPTCTAAGHLMRHEVIEALLAPQLVVHAAAVAQAMAAAKPRRTTSSPAVAELREELKFRLRVPEKFHTTDETARIVELRQLIAATATAPSDGGFRFWAGLRTSLMRSPEHFLDVLDDVKRNETWLSATEAVVIDLPGRRVVEIRWRA
jgi:DNA invertase Pin-like site-specific DNA recombinase